MWLYLAIALGGAVGAVSRYGLTNLITDFTGTEFPYGILLVNILGSLAIGLCFVAFVEKGLVSNLWREAVMAGLLGAFTTFSTFSLQTLGMLQAGRLAAAAAYVVGSVVLCILATALGIWLSRQAL